MNILIWVPVVLIAIICLTLYIPEFLGFQLGLSYTERTTILLTFALTIFAGVEGYSTYTQVEIERNKRIIEDARNELEKAYGPLYSLLNKFRFIDEETKEFYLNDNERNIIDQIMATYPFMFPTKIIDFWTNKILNLSPLVDLDTFTRKSYRIPIEFRNMINEEYRNRVKKYSELLKR